MSGGAGRAERVAVVGLGAVGSRAARTLLATPGVGQVLVHDLDARKLAAVSHGLGPAVTPARSTADLTDVDAVVVATPADAQEGWVRWALRAGVRRVVSTADHPGTVRALLRTDAAAHEAVLVLGAAFGPGLGCLLAAHGGRAFDQVEEVHVARAGTGGPACDAAHHRALAAGARDWRDGAWVRRTAGSGRELVWFPDPVGGRDCYRAGLADPSLLVPAFPGIVRVTARLAATRRDRLTARLPPLRTPRPEGGVGAVAVELRGRQGSTRAVQMLGAVDRPATAAGTVAALAAVRSADYLAVGGPAVGGLAALDPDPTGYLRALVLLGITVVTFEGTLA